MWSVGHGKRVTKIANEKMVGSLIFPDGLYGFQQYIFSIWHRGGDSIMTKGLFPLWNLKQGQAHYDFICCDLNEGDPKKQRSTLYNGRNTESKFTRTALLSLMSLKETKLRRTKPEMNCKGNKTHKVHKVDRSNSSINDSSKERDTAKHRITGLLGSQ